MRRSADQWHDIWAVHATDRAAMLWQAETRASESTRLVIAAMEQFWSEHRPLCRVTDLLADEGDPRFTSVKARTFAELTDAFAQVAQRAGDDRRSQLETRITDGIVVTTSMHTTAREVGFAESGVPLDALRATPARPRRRGQRNAAVVSMVTISAARRSSTTVLMPGWSGRL